MHPFPADSGGVHIKAKDREMHRLASSVVIAGSIAISSSLAVDESGPTFKGAQVFYEFGNIVKGEYIEYELDNMWTQRFGGTFDMEARRSENLSLYLGAGSVFWHAIPEIATQTASQVFFGDAILTKAYADFEFGEAERPVLEAKLGFFPVKYNQNRNLGEYLFRTGTYPTFVITGNGLTAVNVNSATVLGTQLTYRMTDYLSHDLFITSERSSYPLHDFSLSYLAKFSGEIFKFGAGIQLSRVIPVRPSLTTPNHDKNKYFTYQNQVYANNPEYYNALATGATNDSNLTEAAQWKAVANLVDSLNTYWDANPTERPAMDKYTFKGIKPLVMASVDFKPLFHGGLFRGDEMVLYSEATLMGIENHPIFYENRMDRLAMMVGLNIPTFGLLDDLTFEVEHLASKFVNGYLTATEGHLPLPDYNYNLLQGYDPEDWSKDNWKWSLFMNKHLMKGFSLQAQAANDHLRGRRHTRIITETSVLVGEPNPLSSKGHWYYYIKLQASI